MEDGLIEIESMVIAEDGEGMDGAVMDDVGSAWGKTGVGELETPESVRLEEPELVIGQEKAALVSGGE